jgi:hypothetical protein
MSYSDIEAAVIEEIVTHFEGYLTPRTVMGGESDALFEEMFTEGRNYGVLIEYAGGGRPENETFKGAIWEWVMVCVFMIRFSGDVSEIEDSLRAIVDRMGSLFQQDPRLAGVSPRVYLNRIDPPDVVEVNNFPMYWLPFEIIAWEKL